MAFVRERQARGEPALAQTVLDSVLVPLGLGDVSLRTVQRFLLRLGLEATVDPIEGDNGHWHERAYVRRFVFDLASTHLLTPAGTSWSEITSTKRAALKYLESIGEEASEAWSKEEAV